MGRTQLSMGLLLSVSWVACGCRPEAEPVAETTPPPVAEEQNSTTEDLKSQLGSRLKQLWSENSDTLLSQVEEFLDQNDTEFAELEERANELGAEGLEQWEQLKPELFEKKKALMAKLQEIKEAGPSQWLRMKDDLDQAWKNFKSSMEQAKKALDIP
jgi:hypothetical protein